MRAFVDERSAREVSVCERGEGERGEREREREREIEHQMNKSAAPREKVDY